MKALITGGGGLLAQELRAIMPNAVVFDHQSLDVADEAQVWRALTSRRVDVVFHCAAMTNVDACERDPAGARRANCVGARIVASTCASLGICLTAISSDYVLDGRKDRPLLEDAPIKALSVYAKTKAEGEAAIMDVNPNAAIVRTSWLYGRWRRTFIDRVLAKGEAGEAMPISCDQVSSPTWVRDLAPALVRLGAHRPSGIFHLTGEGHVTRDDFARAALEASGLDPGLVRGVENYPSPARRPHYSALTNTRARALSISLPSWEDSVRDYVTCISSVGLDETVA